MVLRNRDALMTMSAIFSIGRRVLVIVTGAIFTVGGAELLAIFGGPACHDIAVKIIAASNMVAANWSALRVVNFVFILIF